MVLEDLHERLRKSLDIVEGASMRVEREMYGWRCTIHRRDAFGEGTAPTIAEAIEQALDELDIDQKVIDDAKA